MPEFGIKDAIDILIVAVLLYYIFRQMKESGTINIFYGVMAFIAVWAVAGEVFELRLTGSILDQFVSIGLLVLVIIFQDQIKRFLIELGSHRRWRFLHRLFNHRDDDDAVSLRAEIMPIVYACMAMSKTKTGALIVIHTRLIENIFFKNSPLHDGAMIIANHRIVAAGCILPVSHDSGVPRSLGLRHRSALGIAQETDAIAVVVSEETGYISVAHRGALRVKLSTAELEKILYEGMSNE